jgi:hypothetical protein
LVEEAAGVVVGLSVEKKEEAGGRDSREADDDGLWWAIVGFGPEG